MTCDSKSAYKQIGLRSWIGRRFPECFSVEGFLSVSMAVDSMFGLHGLGLDCALEGARLQTLLCL